MCILAFVALCGLSIFFTVSPVVAQGRIYKWVDANGRVHYSDAPIGQAEDIDAILPPAARFVDPSTPQAAGPPPVSEETPSLLTPPPSSPEPDSSSPPAAESPPVTSLPEEESAIGPPVASEESLPPEGEPTGRETIGPVGKDTAEPTDGEAEDTAAPPTAAESFNFTAFDNFLPGRLEGGEAPDEGPLAPEGIDNAAEELEEEGTE